VPKMRLSDWPKFLDYVLRRGPSWQDMIFYAAIALAVGSGLRGDPHWLTALILVTGLFYLGWSAVAALRGFRGEQSKVHDRNDIWGGS
jgi:threonine/homoserine/homoserine lactone efflux protein